MTKLYFFSFDLLKTFDLVSCLSCFDRLFLNKYNIKVKGGPIIHILDYSPTKSQKLLGNPDKSANPTASSPACAGLAGEHCIYTPLGKRPKRGQGHRKALYRYAGL